MNLNFFISDKWIKDLSKVGYRDIRSIPDDEGTFTSEEKSPCIGRDALSGVYFHPATALGAQLSSTGSKWLKGQELYLQYKFIVFGISQSNFYIINNYRWVNR